MMDLQAAWDAGGRWSPQADAGGSQHVVTLILSYGVIPCRGGSFAHVANCCLNQLLLMG